jgi:hypothetical protein
VTRVLALAATNVVSALLFAALYATAGAQLMSQAAFLACLGVIFVLVTILWVRTEARHRDLGLVRRIGRVSIGLVIVLLGLPVVVLLPVFWLDTQLSPDLEFTRYLAPIMTLVLISLTLVVVVNAVGALIAIARSTVPGIRRVQ